MKFLQVGLGSMGKRRIRCLKFLGEKDIIAYDPREDRRKEVEEKYSIKVFNDFSEAMNSDPDVLIISTPPDSHMYYALNAAKSGKHFFTEASVLSDGYLDLIELIKNKNIIGVPSCTLRFHPLIKKLKFYISKKLIGKILSFTYQSGQYLPDWHPWEDYRKYYVSKKETGACREIVPFELVWITWIFGYPSGISCFKDKLTKLETEIDDIYQILLKFKCGIIGHLMVDVISRVPYRIARFLGEEGVIEMDWGQKSIFINNVDKKKIEEFKITQEKIENGYIVGEEMYIEEIEKFIKTIKKKETFGYTFEEDLNILKILYSAENSSKEKMHILF